MSRRRTPAVVAGLAATVLGLVTTVPATAAAPPFTSGYLTRPGTAGARVQGNYAMSGVLDRVVGIPGEQTGERVLRTWNVISPCAAGPCPILGLHRQRQAGVDALFLRRAAPGFYTGTGHYETAAICAGRTYRHGIQVTYTVTVGVTAAAQQPDGTDLATAIEASYTSRAWVGRTPCFQAPIADAASYTGLLTTP